MAIREFRSRYAGSLFGVIWNLIHPLSLILIYTFVFSRVMKAKLPGVSDTFAYTIYLCSALLPWMTFLETGQRSATAFLDNRNLIQKLRFPIEAPVAWITTFSLLNGLLTLGLLVVLVVALGHHLAVSFLLLPVVLLLMQIWAFGLGLIFASLTVFFRDVAQMVIILFQLWFWLTPIVYVQRIVPPQYRLVQALNPMYYPVRALHTIVVDGRWPLLLDLGVLAGVAVVTLLLGYLITNKLRRDIPDEI
jgi:lipopolysaccharide transport system permease protein